MSIRKAFRGTRTIFTVHELHEPHELWQSSWTVLMNFCSWGSSWIFTKSSCGSWICSWGSWTVKKSSCSSSTEFMNQSSWGSWIFKKSSWISWTCSWTSWTFHKVHEVHESVFELQHVTPEDGFYRKTFTFTSSHFRNIQFDVHIFVFRSTW